VRRRHQAIRISIAIVVLATLATLGSMVRRGPALQQAGRPIQALDGWRVRGLRHASRVGDSTVLGISVEEASLRRVRFGMFRIGFAWELVVRNARVDLDVGFGRPGRSADRGRRDPAGAVSQRFISGVRVDGLEIRLEGRDGAWVELAADRCDARLWDGGRIVFRDNVRLESGPVRRVFSHLVYDPSSRRIVEARGMQDRGRSDAAAESESAVLEDVNAIIRRPGDIDIETLRSHLVSLSLGS